MDDIIHDYNGMSNVKSAARTEEYFQVFARQIEHWERQSHGKIDQTAKELREELAAMTQQYQHAYKEKLGNIAKQISTARRNGDYFEQDLQQWTERLHGLNQVLLEQQNVRLYQSDATTPSFVSKISFFKSKNDNFKHVAQSPLPMLPHPHPHPHQLENCTNLTVPGEYASSDHLFRFKMEYKEPNHLLLVGIISATSPGKDDSQENPTFYGWSTDNIVYLHGIAHTDYKDYRSDINRDDAFQLILDCQRQTIRFINERTRRTDELTVDLAKCPFPWKPHVRLLLKSTH